MSSKPAVHHPWKARVAVSLIMLALAFIGLTVVNLKGNGAWVYWRLIAPIYGLLALWLSWYLRRKQAHITPVKLWHECLHWLGLILAVLLIMSFVHIGIMSRFLASLSVLTVVSLCLYLAGVYIEISFMPIGIFLGLLTMVAAYIEQYLYLFIIPASLITLILIILISKRRVPDK